MSFWNQYLNFLTRRPVDLDQVREQRDRARSLAEYHRSLCDEARMNLRRSEQARHDAEAKLDEVAKVADQIESAAASDVRNRDERIEAAIERDGVWGSDRNPDIAHLSVAVDIQTGIVKRLRRALDREGPATIECHGATSSRATCRHCGHTILRRSTDGVWFSKGVAVLAGTPVTSDCNDSPDGTHTPAGGEGR